MGRLCCCFTVEPNKKTLGCIDTFALHLFMVFLSAVFSITLMAMYKTVLIICLLGLPVLLFDVAWIIVAFLKKKEILGWLLILHKVILLSSFGVSCYYLYYFVPFFSIIPQYIIILIFANAVFLFTDCSINKYEESFDLYSNQTTEPAYQNYA